MKKSVKIIIGIAAVLIIEVVIGLFAFNHFSSRNILPGNRGGKNSIQMSRSGIGRGMDRNSTLPGMRGMNPGMGSGNGFGMRQGMAPGQGFGMRQGMVPGQGFGMRPNMVPGQVTRSGRGAGRMLNDSLRVGLPGPGRSVRNIPTLTEKQKKDIADLRVKQQDEMNKLIESQRNKVLDLLTPEQKKLLNTN